MTILTETSPSSIRQAGEAAFAAMATSPGQMIPQGGRRMGRSSDTIRRMLLTILATGARAASGCQSLPRVEGKTLQKSSDPSGMQYTEYEVPAWQMFLRHIKIGN